MLRMLGNLTVNASSGNWSQLSAAQPSGANAAANNLIWSPTGTVFFEVQATTLLHYGSAAHGTGTTASGTAGSDYSEMTLLTGRIYNFTGLDPRLFFFRASTTATTAAMWVAD